MKTKFEDFFKEIVEEAKATGSVAMEELKLFEVFFRNKVKKILGRKSKSKLIEFPELVSEYLKHHTAIELAGEFECAVSTVNRWAKGTAKPREGMKIMVIEHINWCRIEEQW
jgi:hypothetical protein